MLDLLNRISVLYNIPGWMVNTGAIIIAVILIAFPFVVRRLMQPKYIYHNGDQSKRSRWDDPKIAYDDDDWTKKPRLQWRSHSNNLYTNWLNYYVYQVTPYEL